MVWIYPRPVKPNLFGVDMRRPRVLALGMDASEHIKQAQTMLLREIEAFCAYWEMTPGAFGRAAVNDPGFVPRLRSGKNITVRTLDRANVYLRAERAKRDAAA